MRLQPEKDFNITMNRLNLTQKSIQKKENLPIKWRGLWMKGTNKLKQYTENCYVLTLTEVFVNQKRINVCGHTISYNKKL